MKAGDPVVILEAMKMEIPVVAPKDGTVASIDVAVGDPVEAGALLATPVSYTHLTFLHGRVYHVIDHIDAAMGIRAIIVILGIVAVDYCIQLLNAFHVDVKAQKERLVEKYQSFKARWY